jgi:hypothetical protein
MKCAKCMALISTFTLLFPLSMWGRNKNQHSVDIPDSVQIGSTQLKPGNKRWRGKGVQDGKLWATASEMLKTNDSQVIPDDVVMQTTGTNKKALKKIDFSHRQEAFVFSSV